MARARITDLTSIEDVLQLTFNCDTAETINNDLVPALRKLEKAGPIKASNLNGPQILASFCNDGPDPLTLLHFGRHTITTFYILLARCQNIHEDVSKLFNQICDFVGQADSYQLRYVGKLVHVLGEQVVQIAIHLGHPGLAVIPLRDLLWRFNRDPMVEPNVLTTLHPLLAYIALQNQKYDDVISVLLIPILDIDREFANVSYHDHLFYHYYGGIILAVRRLYVQAIEMFELVVSAPGPAVSMIQLDAYKKLILVQLIHRGKTSPPPKYTSSTVSTIFRNTSSCYLDLAEAFNDPDKFDQVYNKYIDTFRQDFNIGLITICRRRIGAQNVKKLTDVYSTVPISVIAHELGLPESNEGRSEARQQISKMIDEGEICAKLSGLPDGLITVEFLEDPEVYNDSNTIKRIESSITNAKSIGHMMKFYDDELGRNKDFLSKALTSAVNGSASGYMMDEDVAAVWDEDEDGVGFDNRVFA